MILMFLVVGFIIALYYLLNPTGVLTVTYERRSETRDGSRPSSPSEEDMRRTIEALDRLRVDGVITDEEFKVNRRAVLDRF